MDCHLTFLVVPCPIVSPTSDAIVVRCIHLQYSVILRTVNFNVPDSVGQHSQDRKTPSYVCGSECNVEEPGPSLSQAYCPPRTWFRPPRLRRGGRPCPALRLDRIHADKKHTFVFIRCNRLTSRPIRPFLNAIRVKLALRIHSMQ